MSFPLSFSEPDPSYNPEQFDLSTNYNVLHISEIHAFEPEYKKEEYRQHIGQQLDAYAKEFDIDRISILGDTGEISDVEAVLDEVDDEYEVWIIAGDEDKVEPNYGDNNNPDKDWTGWFYAANSDQPFDVGNDYTIFDEGYETEIRGHTVQAAHHPNAAQREDRISFPDPRSSRETDLSLDPETATPEELYEARKSSGFLSDLFSVRQDSNENTVDGPIPSMEDGDVFLYDHVHMPYARKIYDSAVMGLGGRSHNYQIKADSMPLRSIHVTSFDEDLVHAMHFDAEKDQIFEHQVFDFEDELEMYDVPTPRGDTNCSGYLPLQSRFVSGQYREEAREEQLPPLWSNRDQS